MMTGTLSKVIVTTLILGVTGSAPSAPTSIQNTIMYEFPPSAPTSSVHFSSPPRNLDVAESASFFSDGAIASHPLHGLAFSAPGFTGFMNIRGGTGGSNPFVRSMISAPSAPGTDILQTAAQTYFIEPAQPTTTTQKPTFKKRKTRRPITVLAEKSKRQKAEALNDNPVNDVPQGNPVPFNPFRQIVNTSFGRSRPSDSKFGRSRSRPGAAGNKEQTETGSLADINKNHDSLNEIPSTSTEGEPRVLGQRRKPLDIRPLRPTSSFSPLSTTTQDNENNNANTGAFIRELPKPRRFPPRPRPQRPEQNDNENNPSGSGDVTNAPSTPPRPRNLSRRPRPTTTFPSTDDLTEITAGVTSFQTQPQPLQTQTPQTQPPQTSQQPAQQEPRRARPGRPLGGSRFGGNRLTLTTTPYPEPDRDINAAAPSRQRRPIRPTTSTTRQASNPSTEAPEFSRLPQSAGIPDVPRLEGRPSRGDRPGFVLRPRPTSAPTSDSENEVGVTSRPLNRRRKRPTTTVAAETPSRSVPAVRAPAPAVNYNQQFTGGIVRQNAGAARNVPNQSQNEESPPQGRRNIPQVVRTRPSPFSTPEFPPVQQIQVEQQHIQQIVRGQLETLRSPQISHPIPEEQPLRGDSSLPPSSPLGNSAPLIRRPSGPSAPQAEIPQPIPQLQQNYGANQALTGPNNYNVNPGLYNFPSQENLGFYPGFDNVLGVSSNVKSVQESPSVNKLQNSQFSQRTTAASADEPEISHADSSSAEGTEKKSEAPSGSTPNPTSGEESVKEVEPSTPPKKLSPLERLQQNRQAAARRLLTPRKPTEKTTPAPEAASQNQKPGKSLRKSLIPPRMLRPRGKLPAKEEEKPEETSVSEKNENEKSIENNNNEINNESTSTSSEPDAVSNAVPISPKTEEPAPTPSRKPTILENAMRRRAPPLPGKNSPLNKQQSSENMKITPPTPPNHDPDAPPPDCEAGQRYSKIFKEMCYNVQAQVSRSSGIKLLPFTT